MSKTIKIDFSQTIQNQNGETFQELSAGKAVNLTLGMAMSNLILGLTSLSNSDSIRAWNLFNEILKNPQYDIDSDKLDFITNCFEKTEAIAAIKAQILILLRKSQEELQKA